jgi:peptide/nickel transport system substrate-binding protein
MQHQRHLLTVITLMIMASLILTACGTPATNPAATSAPVAEATEAPAPTAVVEQPTAEPATNGGCPAPAGTAPIAFPDGGKSVTGGWTQEPNNITPYYTVMNYAIWIAQLTLVGLGEWNEQGAFVPELAAQVPTADNGGVSPDGLTITWHLRPCLYWSDGEPLTSADVKFTWESIMDEGNVVTSRNGYDRIESIETPDDTTVVIKFSQLYPPWQTLFTQGPNNSGAILPKHILEGKTGLENEPFIHQPTIASGPFVITEWVAGDHMTLLPNPNFYSGRAKLDRIAIKFVPDPETALAALQTGDIDWYPDFSESDIATVGALEPNIHLRVVPGSDFEHYFFNLGTVAGATDASGNVIPKSQSDVDGFCPFRDIRVRQAFIYGIDRQTIVDTLLEGKSTVPATQWPNSAWTNSALSPEPYDPEKAKALLDEAGYTPGPDGIRVGLCDGQETKLSVNFETTNKQIRVDIALAAQSDLAKIGIEFKPIHTPAGTFFATYPEGGVLPTGQFQMGGYTTGFYPDPYPTTGDWNCDIPSVDNPSGTNNYHLCDPEIARLLDELNATADPAKRKTAVDELQQYIYDQAYAIPMYARANVYGYTDRFVPAPFGFISNLDWNTELWDVK